MTGEFPAQMASNAENAFIWWRHHVVQYSPCQHYTTTQWMRTTNYYFISLRLLTLEFNIKEIWVNYLHEPTESLIVKINRKPCICNIGYAVLSSASIDAFATSEPMFTKPYDVFRKVTKWWDWGLKLLDCSELWHAVRGQCYRAAYHIAERCDYVNTQSRGLKILRDLIARSSSDSSHQWQPLNLHLANN